MFESRRFIKISEYDINGNPGKRQVKEHNTPFIISILSLYIYICIFGDYMDNKI